MSDDGREEFEAAVERLRVLREEAAKRGILKPAPGKVIEPGEPQTFDEEQPDCELCRDRGWRSSGSGVTRCECKTPSYDGPASVPAADLERYGCPPKLARFDRRAWDESRAPWPPEADLWPRKLRDEAGERPSMLLIHGGVGNGKSTVAAWVMRRAMAGGRRCYWIDVPRLIVESLRSIGSDDAARTLATKISGWVRYDVVILDDVAKHQNTDFQTLTVFGDLLRRLHDGPGWTVATTNKTPAELRDWEPSITSRLMSGPVVKMTGGDSRRKKWSTQ